MRRREDGIKVLLHESAHTLGLDEVVVHRVRTETKSAEKDPPLYLSAKALPTGVGVEVALRLSVAVWTLGTSSVTDTVVFGQI